MGRRKVNVHKKKLQCLSLVRHLQCPSRKLEFETSRVAYQTMADLRQVQFWMHTPFPVVNPGFPIWWSANLLFGIIFAKNCMKMKKLYWEHWRIQRVQGMLAPSQSNFSHFHAVFGKNLDRTYWAEIIQFSWKYANVIVLNEFPTNHSQLNSTSHSQEWK